MRGQPPPSLTPTQAWGSPGAFVLAQAPLAVAPSDLARQLGLDAASGDTRAVAWVGLDGGVAPAVVPAQYSSATRGVLGPGDVRLVFGNVALTFPRSGGLTVGDEGLSFDGDRVLLVRTDGSGYGNLAPQSPIALPFDGDRAGRATFSPSWDAFSLFTLLRDDPNSSDPVRAGDLRFARDDGGGAPAQLVYPTLPALTGDDDVNLSLDVGLDPGAPFDGTRTRLLFRAHAVPPSFTCEYGATIAGDAVRLTPLAEDAGDRAGFWFGLRPGGDGAGGPSVYLAPLGPYRLELPGGGGRLMCGTNGLEYVEARTGDVLELVPSRPARGLVEKDGTPVLDSTFTTSWVRLRPGGDQTRAYFGQPGAAANFSTGVVPAQKLGTMEMPAAVASRVRELPAPEPFPMALYGGVLSPDEEAAAGPEALLAFEQSVLAPARAEILRAGQATSRVGALLDQAAPADPVFGQADGTPLAGGRTTTPQGFVVALNPGPDPPAGTWQEVQLARSDQQYLAFGAAGHGAVDPWLATTLLRDQLFLVLNDWERFPMAQRALAVAGFNFDVAPKPGEADPLTVMVFKFATSQSLTQLVATSDAWAQPDVFVGDAGAVAAAQATLASALEVAAKAKGTPDDPFAYFREAIADRPEWTGVLAFNAPIDGNGMPSDLQMLFAGIDGQLRAHHFGVEVNRVSRGTREQPAPPQIEESALLGVIYYEHVLGPEPVPGDFGFNVEELVVAIRNSAVTDFHAKVDVTVNQLFGRDVALDPASDPPNTIRLTGRYQRHDHVGTVTFGAGPGERFTFAAGPAARVLDSLPVSAAALVPVTSAPTAAAAQGGGTDVAARVTFAGQLLFAENPFPGVEGLDLYSYGNDGQGALLNGLALVVRCTLDSAGKRVPGSLRITLDPSGMTLGHNPAAVRPGSLVHGLPIALSGFAQDAGGLDATKLGALPLNVVELSGSGASRVTAKPPYALQFKLPLGSLGALADVHASLDASLVLGWGPSTFTPDDDGAGLMVQLPALSAGAFGFNLQGLLKTTFGDANLMHVDLPAGPVYVILFNNVALSILGMRFPPRVIIDFVLFAGPDGGDSLGWNLAAMEIQQQQDEPALLEAPAP